MSTAQIIAGWFGILCAIKVGLVLQKKLAARPSVAFILSVALLLASSYTHMRDAFYIGLGFFLSITGAFTSVPAFAGACRWWQAARSKAVQHQYDIF